MQNVCDVNCFKCKTPALEIKQCIVKASHFDVEASYIFMHVENENTADVNVLLSGIKGRTIMHYQLDFCRNNDGDEESHSCKFYRSNAFSHRNVKKLIIELFYHC